MSDIFYVAVFPNAEPSDISLTAYDSESNIYSCRLEGKSIVAGKYYYMNSKELTLPPVARIGSTLYSSFDAALAAANASQTNCTIQLLDNCSTSSAVNITNAQAWVYLDLAGHTLTLEGPGITIATEGAILTIFDSTFSEEKKGRIQKSGEASVLLTVSAGTLMVGEVCLASSVDWAILKMQGGDAWIIGAILSHDCGNTRTIVCEDGYLNLDGTLVEQKNSNGTYLVHIPAVSGKNPLVDIDGKSSLVSEGKYSLIYTDLAKDANCITVDDAFLWRKTSNSSFSMIHSVNTGVVTVKSAHFNMSSYSCRNVTIPDGQSVNKIYPAITRDGKSYGYRTLLRSKWAYRNDKEAYVSYAVSEDRRLYPAKFNIICENSMLGFRSESNGYSTDFDGRSISLFTWGFDSVWSLFYPETQESIVDKPENDILDESEDWGYQMNAGPCRVLTREEWEYLLNEREASTVGGVENARYLKCNLYDSYGLLLFPDEFAWPANAGNPPTTINDPTDPYSAEITNAGRTALFQAGCVFLQADGYRVGSTVYYNNSDENPMGQYWSSSAVGNEGDNRNGYFLSFSSDGVNVSSECSTGIGRAVRLFLE